MKNIKELDELVESIILNMKYDPDNWTSLSEDNGFYEVVGWVRTLDWKFTVLIKACSINKPYKYDPPTGLKSQLSDCIKKIVDRDRKQLVVLNKNFLAKVESYKEDLDTYTEEQRAEILRVERKNKLTRVLKFWKKGNED